MKISALLLFVISAIGVGHAQNEDSLRYVNHEKRIVYLEQQNNGLQRQNSILQEEIVKLGIKNQEISEQLVAIDSALVSVDERYGLQLRETDSTIQNNETKRQKSVLWGIVIAVLLALVSAIVYLLLRIRIAKKSNDIELLRARADDLNRQIVERMDKELEELTKVVTQTASSTSSSNAEPDHSLVKALADRLSYMETTLYRMDKGIKGYKNLCASVRRMKDNLLASGYELVEMLGKDYIDGMKATPAFHDDDSIEQGKRIITSVMKPQINYKGKMIQAAEITVSQNI